MDELAAAFKRRAGDFLLEEIFDSLYVMVGGALDFFDPARILDGKTVGDHAKRAALGNRKRFALLDALGVAQRFKPCALD